jgi:hypothetical protein
MVAGGGRMGKAVDVQPVAGFDRPVRTEVIDGKRAGNFRLPDPHYERWRCIQELTLHKFQTQKRELPGYIPLHWRGARRAGWFLCHQEFLADQEV